MKNESFRKKTNGEIESIDFMIFNVIVINIKLFRCYPKCLIMNEAEYLNIS